MLARPNVFQISPAFLLWLSAWSVTSWAPSSPARAAHNPRARVALFVAHSGAGQWMALVLLASSVRGAGGELLR